MQCLILCAQCLNNYNARAFPDMSAIQSSACITETHDYTILYKNLDNCTRIYTTGCTYFSPSMHLVTTDPLCKQSNSRL